MGNASDDREVDTKHLLNYESDYSDSDVYNGGMGSDSDNDDDDFGKGLK